MQPNQQDYNQQADTPPPQAQGQPLPYQVPEYLHMDPVTGQAPPRNNKKPLYIVILVFALVTIIGVTFLIIKWLNGAPERDFLSALRISMNTSYVHREITANDHKLNSSTAIVADSDISDPANPKNKFSYYFKITTKDSQNREQQASLSGDIISLGDKGYVGRLTSPPLRWTKNLEMNQWYTVRAGEQPTSDPDPLGLVATVSNPLSSILIGKYSADNQQTLLNYIQDNHVYTINNVQSKTDNGKKYDVYSTSLNYKALQSFNTKVNEIMKTKATLPEVSSTNQVQVWIDTQTHRVTKVVESIKQNNTPWVDVTTSYTYPDNLSISLPADATI